MKRVLTGPHHRRRSLLRGHGYFKRLGPGIVTGAADDDPSGIGTYSQVGAAYGLSMAWTAVWVAPLAAAVQEMSARLGLATGSGLSTLIRRRFPRWVLYFAVTTVAIANTFNIAADLAAMGASAALVVSLPGVALTVGMATLTLALELLLPYHRYSRLLRWFALSLLAYVLVLAAVHVDWSEVLRSAFVPTLPDDRAAIAALIAVFGTTVSPYLFFWQASEEVEEERALTAEEAVPTDEHFRSMRVDVIGGMLSACFIAFAIIVAAASTLHRSGVTTVRTADEAAAALEPIAGRLTGLLFSLGVVGLGLLAVPVLAGSTAYALSEAMGWHEGLSARLRDAGGFYSVIAVSLGVGVLLDLAGMDPIRGLYYSAILNGLTAPPLIALMLMLATSRGLGARRSGALSIVLAGTAVVVSVALPIAFLAW